MIRIFLIALVLGAALGASPAQAASQDRPTTADGDPLGGGGGGGSDDEAERA
jgi:hypothetical protein